jgi:hypothetical protein
LDNIFNVGWIIPTWDKYWDTACIFICTLKFTPDSDYVP